MTELTDELYEQIKEQVLDRYRKEENQRHRLRSKKRQEENRKAVHELKNAIINSVGSFYDAFEVEDVELKVASTIIQYFAGRRHLSFNLIESALYAWSAGIDDSVIVELGCIGSMPMRIYSALKGVESAIEDFDIELAGGGVIDSREALQGLTKSIKTGLNKDD